MTFIKRLSRPKSRCTQLFSILSSIIGTFLSVSAISSRSSLIGHKHFAEIETVNDYYMSDIYLDALQNYLAGEV